MKLAILGASEIACHAALVFHRHGAAITWFNDQDTVQHEFPKDDLRELAESQSIKTGQILSVTKRFLGKNESIPGRSRLYDLFRIIYKVDPKEFIASQKQVNPEIFERLNNEMIQSLQTDLEMYEDFDVVLDFRTPTINPSISVVGRAVGEKREGLKEVYYGYNALKKTANLDAKIKEAILVGSGHLAAKTLIGLKDWIKRTDTRLFLVSTEEDPFENYFQTGKAEEINEVKNIFFHLNQEFELEVADFHKKLREWQSLDNFVQAKIPSPAEPIPRLVFFSGHNVTALDQLIENNRLFFTLEKPDFREGKKHPENNFLDLKTIGVDVAFSSHDLTQDNSILFLDPHEPGYFSFIPTEQLEVDIAKFKGVENEIFKIFSPAASH